MTIRFPPAISAAGTIRLSRVLGHHEIRVSADETAGALGIWEEAASPGEGPPLHIHHREDEMFFVLEGRFRFRCGDDVFDGGPGTTAVLPRGVPHTWQCLGTARGRMLVSVTPGGFETFFLDLAALPHADPVAVSELAARYGLQFCLPGT